MIVEAIVAQNGPANSLSAAITAALAGKSFDRLDVAVAYATRSGLTELRTAAGGWPGQTRWVIGLDDAITQPQAIDNLLVLPGAEVHLAALSSEGRRFHPKLYRFWSSQDPASCLAIIGSANMTLHGLERNGEIGIILGAETAADGAALEASWQAMRALAKPAAAWDLEAYRAAYAKARQARRKLDKEGTTPAPPEDAEPVSVKQLDPNPRTAINAWLEVGTATQGKEVEIPKALLPYFRLPQGQESAILQFRLPNGLARPLRLIDRQGNDMWRIEFTAEVIQAIAGRPSFYQPNGVKRAELVLVFEHLAQPKELKVGTAVLGSPVFLQMEARSASIGASSRTTKQASGRGYGVA